MSAHTPGPWGFNVGKNGEIQGLPAIRIFSDSAQDMVLDFPLYNGSQDIANARLIAASPDLLAACEEVRDWMVSRCSKSTDHGNDELILLNKAIAKAKGEL